MRFFDSENCDCYIPSFKGLTNSSLRERFGLEATAAAPISRLIKEAVKSGLIKPFDAETSQRYMKYIPFWA